jgi:hypothetical protein
VRVTSFRFATMIVIAILSRTVPALAQEMTSASNDTSALFDAQAYLRLLGPASKFAARILAGLGNPVFVPDKPVALQALTPQPVSVTVLFPTEKQFPQYLPLLRSSTHSFCQIIPPTPPDNIKNLLVCDPDTLRQLDILIRISHSPAYVNQQMKNDWTYMRLLRRIQTEPDKVLSEAKPTVSDEHMQEHMSFILVFLLAHETWHLTHGAGTNFESDADRVQPSSDTELTDKLLCRNYEAFPRQGLSLFAVDHPTPLAEEGTTEDPSFRNTLKTTRQIWQEEEDADHFGAETMVKLVAFIKDKDGTADIDHLSSEIIQNFGNMMLQIWFSKMQPFAQDHCAKFANQDFYLTRCMCQDKSIYGQVINLFGATHPPIVLRMHTAAFYFASQLRQNIGIDLTKSTEPDALVALLWLQVIDGLSDVPLKLSMAACMNFPKVVVEHGNIVQVLPDLAGFVGPDASTQHPGYPSDEAKFIEKCLVPGHDSVRPPDNQSKTPQSTISTPNTDHTTVKQTDLLSTRKDVEKLPPTAVRDCAFRMAGITDEIATMDQLDKDMLYMRAAWELPSEFAEKYPSQLSADKRTKLQMIVKLGATCNEP